MITIYPTDDAWLSSGVYAPPHPQGRARMWEELCKVSTVNHQGWLVAGDLNMVADPLEKEGGMAPRLSQLKNLHSNISECGLLYLGYI